MKKTLKVISITFILSLLLLGPVLGQFSLTERLNLKALNKEEETYQALKDAQDLQAVNEKLDGKFKLVNDLDLEEIEEWSPIGSEDHPFSGEIIGDGFKIKNMDEAYKESESQGVVDVMTQEAVLDLDVEFKAEENEAAETEEKEENEGKEEETQAKAAGDERKEAAEGVELEKEKQVKAADQSVDVSNWNELNKAMADENVKEINLTADIERTSTSRPTATRSKRVNGNGHKINTTSSNYGLLLADGPGEKTIEFNQVIFEKTGGSRAIIESARNAQWQVNLVDVKRDGDRGLVNGSQIDLKIKGSYEELDGSGYTNFIANELTLEEAELNSTKSANAIFEGEHLQILNSTVIDQSKADKDMFKGKHVLIDNSNLTLDIGTGEGFSDVKTLHVKNKSVIDAKVQQIFLKGVNDADITIEAGSQLDLYSELHLVFDLNKTNLTVKDQGTRLNINGNSALTGDNGALISIVGAGSLINVDDQAEINVHSKRTGAMLMNSNGGKFNVTRGAKLNLRSDDNANSLGATLRFRIAGNMEFNVGQNSEINIHKTGGSAPAVRMYGGNNKFIVHSGGKVNVKNEGEGANFDGGSSANNQGIYYTNGGGNLFSLTDKESEINIIAKRGPALDMGTDTGEIVAGPDTVFRAEGTTRNPAGGIFNAGVSKISIDRPLFYDFRNDRVGGGNVFNVSNRSSFKSIQSDLSVWDKGSNLDGDPSGNWPLFDYELGGVNFANIVSSNVDDFNSSVYHGADHYSRMSGNNARPVIDETRIPTDADKYLFGHASVPIGNEEGGRDAWTDEVHVILEYETSQGEIKEIQASSYGMDKDNPGLSIYGEKARAGMFKAAIPKGEFAKLGDKFRVVKAWRGDSDFDSGRVHVSKDEDLKAPERTTIDVTPPQPVESLKDLDKISGYDSITNATKRIAGVGTEENVTGRLAINERFEKTTFDLTENQAFTHNLDGYLEKDDQVSFHLRDQANYYTEKEVGFELPKTHTKEGNINPFKTFTYHDAEFTQARAYQTLDILPHPEIKQSVDVRNDKAEEEDGKTRVGSILTYTFDLKNKQKTKTDYDEVYLQTDINQGLKIDLSSIKINNKKVDESQVEYDSDSNQLTINLGRLDALKAAKISYETEVLPSLEGKTVCNLGDMAGNSVREAKFEVGKPNPALDREVIQASSNEVCNPGGEIGESLGELELISAPDNLSFTAKISSKEEEFAVNKKEFNKPLLVVDERPKKEQWELHAKMLEELVSEDGKNDLAGGLIYRTELKDQVLSEGTVVIHHELYEGNHKEEEFNLSEDWDELNKGLFLQVRPGQASKQNYKGKVQWNLVDAP